MKPIALLCGIVLSMIPATVSGQASEVHSVYFLPMRGGLDQYIANRLTEGGVMRVVTDPAKADAIFTDQIGKPFEKNFEDLYEKQDKAPAKAEPPEGKLGPNPPGPPQGDKAAHPAGIPAPQEASQSSEDARKTQEPPVILFSGGRARGTIFLVNVKTRHVIWSIYEPPKSMRSNELDKTARRIVGALKKDLSGSKK